MLFKKILIAFLLSLGFSSSYAAEVKTKKVSTSKKSKTRKKTSNTKKKNTDFYDLSIIWETSAVAKKDKKEWKSACKKLAKNFKLDTKAGSQGVFRKVKCIGAKSKVNFKAMPTDWFLVMNSNDNVKFDMYFKTSKEVKKSAHIDFGATPKLLKALKDKQVSVLIASSLLDQLPFRFASFLKAEKNSKVNSPKSLDSAVKSYNKSLSADTSKKPSSKKGKKKKASKKKEKKKDSEFKTVQLTDIVPKDVVFFDISFDEKERVWISQPVGYGSLNKKKTSWDVKTYTNTINYKKVYYAHNTEGSTKQTIAILDLLKASLLKYGVTSFWQDLFGTFDHSYVAVRYGYPTISGDSVLSNSYFIGLLAEIRGGPIAGLRVYYDYAPEQTKTSDDTDIEAFNFGWSRLSLGWSFDLTNLLGIGDYVHRVDIAPKLGVYSMDFGLNLSDDTAATFVQDNSIDFGVDLGVEKVYKTLLARLWTGYNFSGLVSGDTTTSSLRGGLDVHYDFYTIPSSSIDIGLLAFTSFERLSFTAEESDEAVEVGDQQILSLSYNLFYIGLGVEMSW